MNQEKKRAKILRKLRKLIEEDFGKECPDYEPECWACQAHKALKILEGIYEQELLDDYEL